MFAYRSNWTTFLCVAVFSVALPAFASSQKIATGKGPCQAGANCGSGTCITVNNASYCSQACGECPAGMYCDTSLFASLNLKVCVKGSVTAPVAPTSRPHVACRSDAECPGSLICGQTMGLRSCTRECSQHAECAIPQVAGVQMDFERCTIDESNGSRHACLVRKECLSNPMACLHVGATTTTTTINAGIMPSVAITTTTVTEHHSVQHELTPAFVTPQVHMMHAMDPQSFSRLLANVEKENFEDERNDVLITAAHDNGFMCSQVAQILGTIHHSDEKLSALRILAPKIADLNNRHTLISYFTFDDDKTAAREILTR